MNWELTIAEFTKKLGFFAIHVFTIIQLENFEQKCMEMISRQ